MTVLAVVLLAQIFVGVLVVIGLEVRIRRSWWERARRKQVMVHLSDDTTMRGFVKEKLADGVVLSLPELFSPDNRHTDLAGDAFLPAGRISWVQIPPVAIQREEVDGSA